MAGRDPLERIDAHMARGNELMERIQQEMRLTREFHATALADFRTFTRELIARVERIGREELRELRRFGAEQRDLRDESRAQTRALLRVLDRLDRLEPGTS